ncbi:MAG TPA: phospholipid carrier-dependent glycosyltransferase [Steroidobacteraceae bacterium]|nr:phospholipid carrier-dependent glycosyltransferase [Steroidobacteraceae bacterium]
METSKPVQAIDLPDNARPTAGATIAATPDAPAVRFEKYTPALYLLFGLLWLLNIHSTLLTEPDEGRYAEIPREMLVSGDWVTPHLNGIVYFEKPPLQYWITAAAYAVFGTEPWVSRLWTWVSSGLGALVCVLAGTWLFGRQAGLLAGMILLSSPLYFVVGHINTLDAGLTLWMTVSMLALLVAKARVSTRPPPRVWMWVAWAAAALGFLSKGPIALAIPVLTMLAYAALTRSLTIFKDCELVRGGALFTVIALPWYALAAARNPEFLNFFFVHENLARYATNGHARTAPWWFLVVVLFAGMLPWITAALRGWYEAIVATKRDAFSPLTYLAVHAAVLLLFFSASSSKLAPYIAPATPALALLAAVWIDRRAGTSGFLASAAVGGCVFLAGAPLLLWRLRSGGEGAESEQFLPWVVAAGVVWLLGALIAMLVRRRLPAAAPAVIVALACLVGLQLLMSGLPVFATSRSAQPVAAALERSDSRHAPLYMVGTYLQGLPFYLRRTAIVVDYTGELEVQLDHRQRNWLPSLEVFANRWRQEERPVAVIDRRHWNDVVSLGLSLERLYEDSRLIVVRKGSSPAAASVFQVQP